jgi:hypothetical protein
MAFNTTIHFFFFVLTPTMLFDSSYRMKLGADQPPTGFVSRILQLIGFFFCRYTHVFKQLSSCQGEIRFLLHIKFHPNHVEKRSRMNTRDGHA